MQNPGFDGSLAGWSAHWPPMTSYWTNDDSEGCAGSGSVTGADTDEDPMQCVVLTEGGGTYHFGAKFKLPLNGNMTKCFVAFFTDRYCSVDSGSGPFYMGPNYVSYSGTGWMQFSTTATAPSGSLSAYVSCAFDTGGGDTAMDQIYLNKTANSF